MQMGFHGVFLTRFLAIKTTFQGSDHNSYYRISIEGLKIHLHFRASSASSGQAKMVQPFWQQDLATGPVLATAAEGPGSKPKGVSKGLQGPKWGGCSGGTTAGSWASSEGPQSLQSHIWKLVGRFRPLNKWYCPKILIYVRGCNDVSERTWRRLSSLISYRLNLTFRTTIRVLR